MIRLYIICEGQTEEEFVNGLLVDHLRSRNINPIPIVIGTRGNRGGNVKYERLRRNIRNALYQEDSCYCTVLIDYYGLPADFPGKAEAAGKTELSDAAEAFHIALAQALKKDLGENSVRRFIPYVQMHEFEALLFSDPERFAAGISRPDLQSDLEGIRRLFASPEHINDGDKTALGKRLVALFPGYERQKPLFGILAALEVGLSRIRQECALFDAWLAGLERLPPPA